jgi:hypothetical protein
MGLDITAYSKLVKLDAVFDADGEPIDPETREPLDWHNYMRVYVNSDFPGRSGSLEHKGCYTYGEDFGFRAGSYGGYNEWREQLAKFAGYPTLLYERVQGYAPSAKERHDAAAWNGMCEGLPFVELVNFSDCEGVICAEVAAKLARDFAEHDERAKATGDDWFYGRYCDWRKAFELASDAGCVTFH